jgi:hypothetical protein
VCALGQIPLDAEAEKLRACAPEFHRIGDCVAARNIQTATRAAYQTARDIGRY